MIAADAIKKHLSYTSANEVSEICSPLFDKFNLNFFDYVRLYPDGSALVLVSNGEWHHCVFKNKYVTTGPMVGNTGIQLWENYSFGKVIEDLKRFNLNNGILVYNKNNSSYVEFFELASAIKDRSVIEFYLNNMPLLQQFLFYFKDKADNLIKLSEKNTLIVPSEMLFSTIENPNFDVQDLSCKNLSDINVILKVICHQITEQVFMRAGEIIQACRDDEIYCKVIAECNLRIASEPTVIFPKVMVVVST